jgi:hypothetical protein
MAGLSHTPGEMRALVAPIFGLDAEVVSHITIVAHTVDGRTVFTDTHVPWEGDEAKSAMLTAFTVLESLRDIMSLSAERLGWAHPIE